MKIIAHIIAYAFVVVVSFSILGFILMMFRMAIASFKGKHAKGAAPMPWWIWWTTTHND